MGIGENLSKKMMEHAPAWVVAFAVWFITSPFKRQLGLSNGWDSSFWGCVILAVSLVLAACVVAFVGSIVSAWLHSLYETKIKNGKHHRIWVASALVVWVLVVWISVKLS